MLPKMVLKLIFVRSCSSRELKISLFFLGEGVNSSGAPLHGVDTSAFSRARNMLIG